MKDFGPPSGIALPVSRPLSPAQARALAETARLDAARDAARARLDAVAGRLSWRPVRGVEQLVLDGPGGSGDRRSRIRVIGPRGPATEAFLARFAAERAAATGALREVEESLAMQAAANRSVRLGAIPDPAARALRALARGPGEIVALGAAALAGYLAAAGRALVPAHGPDPLAPLRERLAVAGGDAGELCRAMRARGEAGFVARAATLAVASDGYVLEVYPAGSRPPGPATRVVAVDTSGMPVPLRLPPIRAYAAERLARAQDGDDAEAIFALAQGRAAIGCLDVPNAVTRTS